MPLAQLLSIDYADALQQAGVRGPMCSAVSGHAILVLPLDLSSLLDS